MRERGADDDALRDWACGCITTTQASTRSVEAEAGEVEVELAGLDPRQLQEIVDDGG